MKSELLPCPFCHESAILHGKADKDDGVYVMCLSCDAQTGRYPAAWRAVLAWNERKHAGKFCLQDAQPDQLEGTHEDAVVIRLSNPMGDTRKIECHFAFVDRVIAGEMANGWGIVSVLKAKVA